jgi:hypothetical protein
MTPTIIIALTIWLEARGEGLAGRVAVAQVIQERSRLEGASLHAVCLRDKQFSCWNTRTPSEYGTLPVNDPTFIHSLQLARFMRKGGRIPGEFTHYHAVDVRPTWADAMGEGMVIGNHVFYRDTEYRRAK